MDMETVLEAKSLTFKDILSYPDLSIDKDAVTFISGESGCGKSTLFKLFNGTESPESGCVRFRGQDITQLDKIELRRKVLLVKQVPYLFRGTVYDNFATFHSFHQNVCPSEEQMTELLKLCCIQPELTMPCDDMSGGERQRIFLAIGLSLMPEVLLLDEPTSALDKELAHTVIANIIDYTKAREMSLVIISHDMALQSVFAEKTIELRRL